MKIALSKLVVNLSQLLSKKIGYLLIPLSISLCAITPSQAGVSISIGINVPVYPRLILVPGYPVYYAPHANSNYFFYDAFYWVYQEDSWYMSSWYNGPWQEIYPEDVPLFVLRIPVRYYRQPPIYFSYWRSDEPPHWGEHWGRDWEDRRQGWDRWDKNSVEHAAPLPSYQKQYYGNRYPEIEEKQHAIQSEHYQYQPREKVTKEKFKRQPDSNSPSTLPQIREQQASPQNNRGQESRGQQQGNTRDNNAKQPDERMDNRNAPREKGLGKVDTPQERRIETRAAPQDRTQPQDRSQPQEQRVETRNTPQGKTRRNDNNQEQDRQDSNDESRGKDRR